MNKNEITREKTCAFYASDYHFEMVSLPYISKKLENNSEVIVLTENNLNDTIKNLLTKINLKEEKKQNILNINWKNDDEEKIKMIENITKKNKGITIFIKGEEKYINDTNKNIEPYIIGNDNVKIINCYNIEEVGENMNTIMSQYNKILSTTGEKEIEKL